MVEVRQSRSGTELGERIREISSRYRPLPSLTDADKPVRVWKQRDRLISGPGKSLCIVIATRGCYWGLESGCTMCGYIGECLRVRYTSDDLVNQFRTAITSVDLEDVKAIKIFTSGSFLDDGEVPVDARLRIFKILADLEEIEEVVIESRPEFVREEALEPLIRILEEEGKKLEIGIGLESASDSVRSIAINKGFSFREFVEAVEIARKSGAFVKTYLLLKPPFLSERRALEDIVLSVRRLEPLDVSGISINPCNVQKGTLLEYLWRRGLYRPPWLWTVLEAVRRVSEYHERVICDPVGAGTRRGPRNCGKCDGDVRRALEEFTYWQDASVLDEVDCECRKIWERYLDVDQTLRALDESDLDLGSWI